MPRLERYIESAVGYKLEYWARENGIPFKYLKLNIIGFKGFPDRLIIWPHRNVLFIEFKKPGEEPTRLQLHIHKVLVSMGFEVKVYDDVNIAVEEIKTIITASRRASAGDGPDSARRGGEVISSSRKGKNCHSVESILHPKENGDGGLLTSLSSVKSDND